MDDWERLGNAVRDRRNALGLAQGEKPPSAATWRKVEKALDPPYAERTVRAVCAALGWQQDSFDRILSGEPPHPAVMPEDDPLVTAVRELTQALDRLADRLGG